MKPRFVVPALIACAAGLSALAAWPVHSERGAAAGQVDVAALQQQADAALAQLRQAQQHRPPHAF